MLYGVSTGNGNDGVSHMFADYYVRTDDPWRLARLALVSSFKDEWKQRALDAADVDGESEYTISAMILDPLDEVYDEESGSWSESNGAWLIVEVFPEDDPREDRPVYESLDDAFESADLTLVGKED
jgi:hypothetical protein